MSSALSRSIALFSLTLCMTGCIFAPRSAIRVRVDSGPNPWSSLDLYNDPENFQFAIVTDRTGGERPGIFAVGVEKLNLLKPEFVMSVGDLIDGYTEDGAELDRQWEEFDGFIDRLEAPFFYVPGNHDISNAVMERLWIERYGKLYYHFVYRDVLFLCLDTEDPPSTNIGEEQQRYAARALAKNPDVRWTFVFLHKPMWDERPDSGWFEIEELLRDRPHTVFAGHRHRYVKYERNNQSYITLATTGGGSRMRGRRFGEFDHVVWVTMTDAGPRIANLMLDGVWDENVRTEALHELMAPALYGRVVTSKPLFENLETFEGATTILRVTNDADIPMKIRIEFNSTDQVKVTPAQVERTVQPNSVELIDVKLEVSAPVQVEGLERPTTEWVVLFEPPGQEPLEIEGRHRWR